MTPKTGCLPVPLFAKQQRFGLVLYGGVSLAVYMNGVCHEFFNSIRGRGVYKLVKALIDSDIVVDIISGTSAGGVNGVLLGYAIANSNEESIYEFNKYEDLWIDKGGFLQLLDNEDNPKAIFSGSNYQQSLEMAFSSVYQQAPDDDWYSDFRELDLFITATDLDGKVIIKIDDNGNRIDIKEHRVIFHLKQRQDQCLSFARPLIPESQNDTKTRESLAKLCRLTSCFPLAFPAVEVNLDADKSQSDYRLVKWGRLRERVSSDVQQKKDRKLTFVDGGVLNNRPFSSTISTIYTRTSDRPAMRRLFYVDPNPESFLEGIRDSQDWSSPLRIGYHSKIVIPNYQSIKQDIDSIEHGNRSIQRYRALRDAARRNVAPYCKLPLSQSEKATLSGNHYNAKDHHPSLTDLDHNYKMIRLYSIVDGVIDSLLSEAHAIKTNTLDNYQALYNSLINARQDFSQSYSTNETDSLIEQRYNLLQEWDVGYSIRMHCFMLGEIAKQMDVLQAAEIPRMTSSATNEESYDSKVDTAILKIYLRLRYLGFILQWQLELLKLVECGINIILKSYANDDQPIPGFSSINGSDRRGELAGAEEITVFIEAIGSVVLGDTTRDKSEDLGQGWLEVLNRYYDLMMNFFSIPDVHEQHFSWPSLQLVIPEQAKSLSRKIFAELFQMPICNIAYAEDRDDLPRLLSLIRVNIAKVVERRNQSNEQAYREEASSPSLNQQDPNINSRSMLKHIEYESSKCLNDSYIEIQGLECSNSTIQDNVLKMLSDLQCFEEIDQKIFQYDYLSKVSSRNFIHLSRVAPSDAKEYGFGHKIKSEQKLKGLAFNAFSGFFKKEWRTNDILWGRFDGIERLIDTLVTSSSIWAFRHFASRYINTDSGETPEKYVAKLISESLPYAISAEKTIIRELLLSILNSPKPSTSVINDAGLDQLKEALVKAAQRSIILAPWIRPGNTSTNEDKSQSSVERTKEIMQRELEECINSANNPMSMIRRLRKPHKENKKLLDAATNLKEQIHAVHSMGLDVNGNSQNLEATLHKLDQRFVAYQEVKQVSDSYNKVLLGIFSGHLTELIDKMNSAMVGDIYQWLRSKKLGGLKLVGFTGYQLMSFLRALVKSWLSREKTVD